MPETKYSCNWRQHNLCCSIVTCKICLCKKCLEEYYQKIINSISVTSEINSKDNSDDSNNLQEPRDSDYDVTVDGVFF